MDLVERAREFARNAYGSDTALDHPLEVADLVKRAGAPEEVVAAAVLHDLIEDTDATAAEIAREFGSRIAALVSTMTEDQSIGEYEERKREHRERSSAAGRDVALLFVADKLSNARRMRRAQKQPDAEKLAHYGATLDLMRRTHPGLPLLDDLDRELRALREDLQHQPA